MSNLFALDKELAYCRVPQGGRTVRGGMRGGRREGVRWRRRMQRAGEGLTGEQGQARAERTANMALMLVTLEVSRLSGWLKYDAYCRVPQRGRTMRGGMRGGRREGVGQRRRMQRAGEGLTGGHELGYARSAH